MLRVALMVGMRRLYTGLDRMLRVSIFFIVALLVCSNVEAFQFIKRPIIFNRHVGNFCLEDCTNVNQVFDELKTTATAESFDLINVPLVESVDITEKSEAGSGLLDPVKINNNNQIERLNGATVRVTAAGVCGSGCIVGRNSKGQVIVLTNAHVAGTRRGRVVSVQRWDSFGNSEKSSAEIIAAGYKRGASIDFALLKCESGFADGTQPIPIAGRFPSNSEMITTTGSPRCEWPSLQVIKMLNDEGQILSWYPEAISGRSGSALIEHTKDGPRVIGLLTWSGGGKGLGQSTTMIIDFLSGSIPKSFEQLPDGVREAAFLQEDSDLIIDQITEKQKEKKPEGILKNRKKRKEQEPGAVRQGPISRLFGFFRRMLLTALLCVGSFVGGYFFAKLRG